MKGARHFCSILTKFGISLQIFIKVPSTKFHGKPSNGRRANTCVQTDGKADGHEEATLKRNRMRLEILTATRSELTISGMRHRVTWLINDNISEETLLCLRWRKHVTRE